MNFSIFFNNDKILPDGNPIDFDSSSIVLDSNSVVEQLDNEPVIKQLDNEPVIEQLDNRSVLVQYSVKYLSEVNVDLFKKSVESIISRIILQELDCFRFLSTLSVSQRHIIHELCEKYGVIHKTTRTRYKVLTISKRSLEAKRNELVEISNKDVEFAEEV
ncbi:unnamed protein product [Brachionus calyciflorus]|uniref:R3H domain-containing protein n=1 Tax=Brachionus calyciflorus TaxID=104777 RepID=A0A813N484_9BILA|nr:unnamed protein product [Brachionus calyciflorus]